MTQSLKSIKANAIVSATSSITTSTNIGGNLLPNGNLTYNIGSSTARWKDIYLSNNTIYLGNTAISANSILPINLDIAPEVLTINVAAPFAGDDISWLWNWQTSTLPYARTTIVNSAQVSVPLYKQGTYQINNFANQQTGNMTQRHGAHLKWIDGAGLDNLVSWAVESGNVSFSDANINGGANTNVQRINVTVPSSITLPTLVAPNISSYMTVTYANTGAYTFSGNGDGDNRTLGPLYRGGSYTFTLDSSISGNPFYFTTDNGTNWSANAYYGEYTTGVTGSRNNGTTGKTTIKIVVDATAPDVLFYQSATDANKRGAIVIKDLAVETNINGNYVLYFQHTGEGHKTPVEIRPIPSLVNQMCVVYDATVGKFVPQDLATYVENTPSFKNKIREVAGTATLIAPNGVAVVPTVLVVEDTTYLPLINNKEGDIAFDAYANTIYVWHSGAWNYTKPTTFPGANVSGVVANATYATTSGTAYSVSASNISGTINLANYATTANSVAGANVSGQVGNALVAGTVYTNSQPNITSIGTLTSLTVSGNATITGNLTISGTTTTVSSNNVAYTDSIIELHTPANLAPLTTDDGKDIGIHVHYYKTSDKHAFFGVANDSLSLEYYVDGNETAGVFSGTYGNFKGLSFTSTATTGTAPFVVNSTTQVANLNVATSGTAGTVTTNAQPNITSVGTLTSLSVTGNITSGNANLGNLIVANYHSGNGSLLTSITGANVTGYVPNANIANTAYSVSAGNISGTINLANYATTANSVAGGNVSGQVSNALIAGTVYTNAQPNITAVGILSSLTTGTHTVLINANIAMSGTSSQISGGNLVSASYLTGTLTTGAQPNITSVGSLTGLTVSNASGVVDFTTTANVTLGNVSNLHISGGSSGQYLQTNGSGTLTWANASGGGGVTAARSIINSYVFGS